jgi:diacylglycerol kinase (ATP)
MTGRWLAIVNPSAGGGAAHRRWRTLARALRERSVAVEAIETTRADDASRYARQACGAFDGIIAVGGDGTVHEVVNGLVLEQAPRLAVAPYGTGNDFARGLRLPRSAAALAQAIVRGRTLARPIGELRYGGAGDANVRRFINGVGMGLDAAVLERLPTRGPASLKYLIGALRSLIQVRATDAHVTFDGRTQRGRYRLVYAGLGTHAGGGMQLTPHAGLQTGALALTLVPDVSLLRLLSGLPALYAGTLTRVPWVQTQHAATLHITAPAFGIEADGQLLGSGPLQLSVRPEPLAVVAAYAEEADNIGPVTVVETP